MHQIFNPTGVLLGSPESTVRRKTVTAARPWHTVWLVNFPVIRGYWDQEGRNESKERSKRDRKGQKKRRVEHSKECRGPELAGRKGRVHAVCNRSPGATCASLRHWECRHRHTTTCSLSLRGTLSLHIPVFNMQKIKKMNKWMHWSDPITFSQSFKRQLVTLGVCQSTLHSCSH